MTLSRRWKIVLVVVGIWLAVGLVFAIFNSGETVVEMGKGDPLTGLTQPGP